MHHPTHEVPARVEQGEAEGDRGGRRRGEQAGVGGCEAARGEGERQGHGDRDVDGGEEGTDGEEQAESRVTPRGRLASPVTWQRVSPRVGPAGRVRRRRGRWRRRRRRADADRACPPWPPRARRRRRRTASVAPSSPKTVGSAGGGVVSAMSAWLARLVELEGQSEQQRPERDGRGGACRGHDQLGCGGRDEAGDDRRAGPPRRGEPAAEQARRDGGQPERAHDEPGCPHADAVAGDEEGREEGEREGPEPVDEARNEQHLDLTRQRRRGRCRPQHAAAGALVTVVMLVSSHAVRLGDRT